jgi:spermidine synthase
MSEFLDEQHRVVAVESSSSYTQTHPRATILEATHSLAVSPVWRLAASALLCGAFLISGAAALIFENLWFHQAELAFGNSVWASSLVLSGFMAGMALGSAIAARWGERLRAPVRAFVLLELVVGLGGGLLVVALPWLTPLLAAASVRLENAPFALNLLRFIAAFALMLVPSTAMGMTLPLLARGMRAWDANFGRILGLLYGWNTLGALLGVLSSELFLVERLGVRQSALAALGCNLAAAVLGWLAASSGAAGEGTPLMAATQYPWRGARWLVAGFASGFAMLALEVVWLRALTLFLNDTPLAFALVLAGVLAGIALGSLAAALWSVSADRASSHAGFVAIAAGLLGVITYRSYSHLLEQYFRPDQGVGTIVALAWPLVVPTAMASGALFALLGAGLQHALRGDAVAVGRLAFVNMLGGGLGSLLAGFVLLPALGMERSLFALFSLYALIGVLLVLREPLPPITRIAAAAVAVIGLALFPWGEMRTKYLAASAARFMRPDDRMVSVRETATGTLVHVEHRLNGLTLFDHLATNAYAMTANDFAARRYMKLFAYLPQALHPKIERALLVGYGIGNTAAAILEDPHVQRLDVADISREILAISREMRAGPAQNPLDDPRVRVHVEDGRQLLSGPGPKYDLITGEPPPPVIAGVVNLYTREYFLRVRARLNEGGMTTHWLPLMNISASAAKSIVRGFCDAFPDCSLWHGSVRNFMLFGTRNAVQTASYDSSVAPFHRAQTRSERLQIGLEQPEQLGALFIGDAPYLKALTRDTHALTDDRPRLIQAPGTREERDALIWEWRDTQKARERFLASASIQKLYPSELRERSARQFENQRLLDDLLFPEQTAARQTQVLHQVLQGTHLRLPVLLLLNSDPDIQAKLAAQPEAVQAEPKWQQHRLAGLLADRDFLGALGVLRNMPKERVPLPELREYVEFVVERGGGSPSR